MNDNGGDPGGSGSSGGKSWERSWTTEEMRQNAHTWNLAGDAGLLKHLQEFSQTVLTRTHATEKALDSLVEEVNTLTAEANTTNNKFLCLANTQFVENRVYDDDDKETPHDEQVTEKKTKEETDAKMLQKVREALSMSVAVLDTMFEPVEINASDSEGELENEKQGTKTLILEPHNPYIHRPLPHLIGSDAFMSDDHIGLGDSPSDGEEHSIKEKEDYDIEVSSESDVDFTPFGSTKRTRDVYSSHSSMSDHVVPQDHKKKKSIDSIDNLGDDSGDTLGTQSAAASATDNNSFAAQLAAKLGKIASTSTSSNSTEEKGSIRPKTTSDDLFGGALSEDENDTLFAGGSGLFSGPPKLFDDLDDTSNSLWGPGKEDKREPPTSENEKTEKTVFTKAQSQKFSDNLFSNSISDDEDDLFSIKPNKSTKAASQGTKSQLESVSSGISKHLKVGELRPGIATSTPERTNEEETQTQMKADERKSNSTAAGTEASFAAGQNVSTNANDLSSQSKKPTGGVPMFGQANVLAGLKAKLPRRPSSSSSESSISDAPGSNSSSVPSQLTNSLPDQPLASGGVDHEWASGAASYQHSQSATIGFSSPALTSTRLSNDDGYQTKNVSNSISSILVASKHDSGSDDDIFSGKSSVPQDSLQISGGLFADVDDDEDDLFAVSSSIRKEAKKPSSSFSSKTNDSNKQVNEGGITSASNSDLSAEIHKSYEQVDGNGVTSPSSSDLSSKIDNSNKLENGDSITSFPTPRKDNEISTSETSSKPPSSYHPQTDFVRNDIYSNVPPPLKSEHKVKKPVSLFDDSDSGEDEFLFSSASSAGSRRSQASTDILAASAISTVEKKPLAKKGLFDDDDTLFGNVRNDPGIDIFGGTSKSTSHSSVIMETPPPLPTDNCAKEDSSLKSDSSSAVHNTSMKSSEKSVASIPVKSAKPTSTQSELQAEQKAGNDNLFNHVPAPPKKTGLFLPSDDEDTGDDLFQNVPKGPSKYSKPSLLVESDNTSRKDDKASDIGVENTSLKPEPRKEKPVAVPDVREQPRKPEPPRTLNIRKETDPGLGLLNDSDDDEDLFGSSALKPKPALPPKQSTKPALALKPENDMVSALLHKDDDGELTKAAGAMEEKSEVDGGVVSVSKSRDALFGGKGQIGLKIDPRALLPGQKPPPRLVQPKENAGSESQKPSVPVAGGDQPAGFDQPASHSTILPSANKDRAKLGVKRRPPSSKARREAARASMNFDQSEGESPLSPDGSSVFTDSVSAVNSNNSVLSPSTDEDDLFGIPQDLPPEYGNQNVPSSDIFSAAPILSAISPGESSPLPKQDGKEIEPLDKALGEKTTSTAEVADPLSLPSESLEKSPSDLLFESEPKVLERAVDNHLFEQNFDVAAKSSSEDLFAPALKSSGFESTKEVDSASKSLLEQDLQVALNADDSSQSVDVSSESGKYYSSSPPPLVKGSSTDIVRDGSMKQPVVPSPQNDSPNPTLPRAARASSDPLNKANLSSVPKDDDLFGSDHTDPGFDDHSSLFPFVKKKPESKPTSNQSLFSQTPALPSKAEKTFSKPVLSGLDDGEDDDLFSSSKALVVKKSQNITSALRGKERKTWSFSDDDDDLFQTESKSASSIPSTEVPSSITSSISPLSTEAKVNTKPFKLPASDETVKKSKPSQSTPKNGLFSDENDDDDLFSKPSSSLKIKGKGLPATKSPLFDDDDDDLFGSKEGSSAKAKENRVKNAPDANAQASASSYIKKENIFDDPLMALHGDK